MNNDPFAEKIKQLGCKLSQFTQDVQIIARDWGDSLKRNPKIIWDEVAAYSKSRFS